MSFLSPLTPDLQQKTNYEYLVNRSRRGVSERRARIIVHLLDFKPGACRSLDVFLLRLTERLSGRGWRTVHIFSGEPSEAFRLRLREIGSPWHQTQLPVNWTRAYELARLIRSYRPEILQTSFMSAFDPALWWLKWASSAAYWVVVDRSSGLCSPKMGLRYLAASLRGALAGLVIDRMVGVSDYVSRRDIEHNRVPARIVRTIYNGVDLDQFSTEGKRQEQSGNFTIAFVGQLIPEKGVNLLIEAVGRIAARLDKPLHVKVAGAGYQRSQLERLAAEVLPGKVEFLGQVEDVPGLLRSADLAVFPSRWQEAFGFVVAEAMACGIPVVASDAGGIPEVIGRDGKAGLIFRNGDLEDLESKVCHLIMDPGIRDRIGRAARERAESRFSLLRMVDQYATLYEELVG